MYQDIRQLKICNAKGVPLSKESVIIDFGCGDGERVYQLRDQGFTSAYGYNKGDYMGGVNPAKLRHPDHASWFKYASDDRLPWPDHSVDVILSDQVFEHVADQETVFREQFRILKPGGVAIHVIPAKWQLIEPHIQVPLGGLSPFKEYWWFRLWAALGVRNNWQKGKAASDIAAQNTQYARSCLNYVNCRQYVRMVSTIGFRASWEELAYMEHSHRPQMRALASLCRCLPVVTSLIRTFKVRTLWLEKPLEATTRTRQRGSTYYDLGRVSSKASG